MCRLLMLSGLTPPPDDPNPLRFKFVPRSMDAPSKPSPPSGHASWVDPSATSSKHYCYPQVPEDGFPKPSAWSGHESRCSLLSG